MSGYIGSKASVTLVDGYTQADADAEFVQDSNGAITVSGSNVGIGTSSPAYNLHVEDTSASLAVISGTSGNSTIFLGDTADNNKGRIIYTQSIDTMKLLTNGSEAMRIDSSGNLLVGTTEANPASGNVAGVRLSSANSQFSADGATPVYVNRKTNDGTIIDFRKNGSTVGRIGVNGGTRIYIGSGDANLTFNPAGNYVFPSTSTGSGRDNLLDLGVPTARFDDIYATNGTIQTSDRNEKQDIASLTATEMLVAARISGLFKTFRWIDSVADKGDDARTHTGVIAQDVQAAFTAEGLDAGDYALFTSATWWETQTDVPAVEADEDNDIEAADAYTRTDTYDTLAEAPDGATERTRMGIRYPELLAFVGAYNEQRFASIETRLAALEGN